MALSPSVVVNGYDLREHFGAEILRIQGNLGLRKKTRELVSPVTHGAVSQGGTYEPSKLRLYGHVEVANRRSLLQCLVRDTRFPSSSPRRGWIILAELPGLVYQYDAVESVDFTDEPGPRRLATNINLALEFTITEVLPRQMAPLDYGHPSQMATSLDSAGSTPDFAQIQSLDHLIVGDTQIRVMGPTSASWRLVSAESGIVHTFDGALTCKGTGASTLTAQIFGLQDTTLINDGDMEASGVTDWTVSGATRSKVGTTAEGYGPMFGTQMLRVITGTGNHVQTSSWSATSGKEYVVRFWINSDDSPDVTLQIGPAGSPVFTKTFTATARKWQLVEVVVPCSSSTTWVARLVSVASGVWYLDDFVVVESILTNGSFEGSWASDVPATWTVSGANKLQSTDERHGTYGWEVGFTGTSDYIDVSLGTVTSGAVYHIVLHAKKTAGTGILILTDTGNRLSIKAQFDAGADYTRISVHAHAFSSGATTLRIFATAAATVVFDDVHAVALAVKSGTDRYHFEPGHYGRRLQLATGECVRITDILNRVGHTVACQVSPLVGPEQEENGFGSSVLWQAASSNTAMECATYDRAGLDFSFQRVAGATLHRIAGEGRELEFLGGSSARRCLGVVCRFAGSGWPIAGMRLYIETSDSGDNDGDTMEQAAEIDTDTSQTPIGSHPTVFLLGDGFRWDGFWVYQYPRSDARVMEDIAPMAAPENRNRAMVYATALTNGQSAIIDLDAYKIELWDSAHATDKLTNAMDEVTGDLPEFFEALVLYSDTNIAGLQVLSRVLG